MAGGEIVIETFDSTVLKGNPLGDPTKRDVAIYLPPKYDPAKRYPAAYGIVGYTGTGKSLLGVDPLGEDLKTKLDRLIRTGKMGPMIAPLVDCFTKVGGNQYRNRKAGVMGGNHYILPSPMLSSVIRHGDDEGRQQGNDE